MNLLIEEISTGELYILAALLGYKNIVGIEKDTLGCWRDNIGKYVKENVALLENKGIISIGLDGTLEIKTVYKEITECIAKPYKIGIVTQKERGKREKTLYLLFGNKEIILERLASTDKYRIRVCNQIEIDDFLGISGCEDQNKPFKISLNRDDVTVIRNCVKDFKAFEAEEILDEKIENKDIKTSIFNILNNSSNVVHVRFVSTNLGYYYCYYNALYSIYEREYIELLSNDENVEFNSIRFEQMISDIEKALKQGREE